MTDPTSTELADRVRTAALAVDGVLDLNGGALGEVATYLPGRRVAGVRLTAERATVQVTAAYDVPMRSVADRVRSAVRPLVGVPVDVVIADVEQPPPDSPAAPPLPAAPTTSPGGPS